MYYLSAEATSHTSFILEVSLLALKAEHLGTFFAHDWLKWEAEAERAPKFFIHVCVTDLFFFDPLNNLGFADEKTQLVFNLLGQSLFLIC